MKQVWEKSRRVSAKRNIKLWKSFNLLVSLTKFLLFLWWFRPTLFGQQMRNFEFVGGQKKVPLVISLIIISSIF